uniref:5-hydroxytryptamine (serotonin) receptor 2C, G protein-coupled-like 1 n=1 Tax=Paramormyrops kingsleyae TaxID=1676925 RepID=A0A3B3Q8V9_9TELE|nr:5-hydroxytryptamine receptor 2A-like [Paramormyrops kingsleyae]XP_023653405.1 5-hydroxytryptamine receptor 2A-like [Paramormyrops kingsleyae]XP_023653406.1 5-hydroxytryptamine receptor 2A-like [Paramormyrops kingsleyae]XP_023653407.1 5-hydroxytryptamine receptor 2A-like [Paramormyrops kingsleyae]XP_023653408.1 5-hydroxytryptamine receptor 2A-like [Paramormyrops kingsleyae]XP_023653409.1 5-hydroxytryptamine receptor 2A-like [Paramormyrops kingsleyae]XP_023653410.1 5-hydroxytryptamine recept
MGASSGSRPAGFTSTTVPVEAALLWGWPAWPLNASVNLNHSLLLGAEPATNLSAARAAVPVAEREKNWPALLFLVVIFLTVGGNILVILAVSLEKRLQNATNFFLRSLAVADMLVGILVMPVSLINILYDYVWPLPSALCPIWIYLDVLFSTASIMHLCAISLDRYVAIRHPIQHSRFNSRTTAKLKIAAVWTISVGISMPIPVIGLHNEDQVFVNGSCALNEERFMLVGSFVAFFIPLVIMVVTYCLTVQVLQRQASVFLHEEPVPPAQALPTRRPSLICLKVEPTPGVTPPDSISILPSSGAASQMSSPAGRDASSYGRRGMMNAIKNERRASKVLGVVFFLFLVMWCPFFITNVTYVLCRASCNGPLLAELLNVFVWVGYISSGVNPLVYTLFNKTYRRAFSNYMRCRYGEVEFKPLPCPPHSLTPGSLCGKGGVDRNSNCRNGDPVETLGLDHADKALEMRPCVSEASINSCHTPTEHTSCV